MTSVRPIPSTSIQQYVYIQQHVYDVYKEAR